MLCYFHLLVLSLLNRAGAPVPSGTRDDRVRSPHNEKKPQHSTGRSCSLPSYGTASATSTSFDCCKRRRFSLCHNIASNATMDVLHQKLAILRTKLDGIKLLREAEVRILFVSRRVVA